MPSGQLSDGVGGESQARMNRRLSTNITFQNEADRQDTIDRLYQKTRRGIIQDFATSIHANLKPIAVDEIYATCEAVSDHDLVRFRQAVLGAILRYEEVHPDQQYSALKDWMNDDMNDIEKARREIASWMDNPKIAYFDTETTGLEAPHVPWGIGSCNVNGETLAAFEIRTLDEKGDPITITPEASKVTGMGSERIAGFNALEYHEIAIKELEDLMQGGFILTGYNTQFDRGMICRALMNATGRLRHIATNPTLERDRLIERIEAIRQYFKEPSHWLETKDTFVRAIGLDPNDTPGRRTRLQDVARATNALTSEENQQHGALADCQLLARIVCNIRKELEEMASKKPAPVAKATEEIQIEPENTGEWPQDAVEHIETLNKALREKEIETTQIKTQYDLIYAANLSLAERVRELENLCEQYQQADGIRHHEARELTWCDLEINGFRFNWTIREGEPVEAAVESAFKTVRALQAIRDTEKVKTFRVGLRDNWQPLKGFEKPANGQKPADEQPPADELEQRRNERPATPKGTPPAANKPNTPPPAKPATPPQQQQPSNQGKTTGEKKQQLCDRIVRHQIDGQNTYDLPFTLSNGKPADRPFAPSKKDTGALEKTLLAAGYDLNSFELGTEYDLPILVEWTVGQQIPKSDPPKFYRDNMTFTIQSSEPF